MTYDGDYPYVAEPVLINGKKALESRLAEIEVEPEFLEEYMTFVKEVGETSVKVEPGVLTLFSMQAKEDPCPDFDNLQMSIL